ncbi:fused response regulator/phosphatase [Catenovulum maritimum]|uniref:Chemotaxis protein CheY n=1 Tax=Catenovulum maritimum TaxID=1513271 RepID=A0A0J8JNP6_9ALTE|nr:fused response regulator/phosphatase [Catenovulum maritimum]KMT66246.1 chemotaxis protein CheY [Catenovulum maritimum]
MHILVVDDQALNRTMLQYMLEVEGYQVSLAENGRVAIETFNQVKPDVVLLDVIMPEMDGFETAPELKKMSGDVHLPIIFITSLDDQKSMLRCLEVGGDDFLAKPFDKVILSAKIKAHGRNRELSIRILEQRNELKYHQNLMDREHKIVEHIFSNALNNNRYIKDILSHHLSPASMFNGDMLLANRSQLGSSYILLGDFTGHGLAAAVGALPTAQTFFNLTNRGMSVGDIAREINNQLINLLPDDMFCAAAIIELSNSGKAVSIWCGGMPDILVVNRNSGIKQRIQAQHMALGILDNDEFEHASINCEVQDTDSLILYTDGVTESENKAGEMFGQERLEGFYNEQPKAELVDVISCLDDFRGATEQADDISLVQINCLASPKPEAVSENSIPPLPWHISLDLSPDDIRNTDPVANILDMVSAFEGMEKHRSTLFLLLAEMYNNSVDHGLLKLDSAIKDAEDGFFEYYMQRQEKLEQLTEGSLTLNISYAPGIESIKLSVTDSGEGFDTSEIADIQNRTEQHGRGLKLILELGEKLEYQDQGRTIIVHYSVAQSKALDEIPDAETAEIE